MNHSTTSSPISTPHTETQLPADAMNFARELAHDTGNFLRATFGKLSANTKHDGTLVTESDLASDRRISAAIKSRFPTHGILSEEFDQTFHGEEWCWVIDPIDGTTNFKWGFPVWGVLIGLLHFGRPVLGVADFPLLNEQYWGGVGLGAWRNDLPIHVATPAEVPSTQLFATCTRALKHGVLRIPQKMRISGGAAYDMACVANGSCVGMLEMTVHVWDVVALWAVIEQAGGVLKSNEAQSIFPLISNTNYKDVVFSLLGACSDNALAEFSEQLKSHF